MKKVIPVEDLHNSGDYLSVLRDFALSKGIGPSTLLAGSNISLADLVNPPPLVINTLGSGIGINLYHALENPIMNAVELGVCMSTISQGSLAVAIQYAPNIKTGFRILSEYFNTRVNFQDVILEEGDQELKALLVNKYQDSDVETAVQDFFDLVTLVNIATVCVRSVDADSVVGHININFTASEPDNFSHDLLGSKIKVLFNQNNTELCIPNQWMNVAPRITNDEISKAALARCESELKQINPVDLIATVQKIISDAGGSIPTLKEMAAYFSMSPSTFKRRLKEQQVTYKALKDGWRFERAKSLIMDDNFSQEIIAEMLGFSDASNFNKSFKNWSGLRPKVYRKTNL
jgi:AraC-like DNA-binding protein